MNRKTGTVWSQATARRRAPNPTTAGHRPHQPRDRRQQKRRVPTPDRRQAPKPARARPRPDRTPEKPAEPMSGDAPATRRSAPIGARKDPDRRAQKGSESWSRRFRRVRASAPISRSRIRARRIDRSAQPRRAIDVDNPHCRAGPHDRVLTAVKARRYATPPLRGASALTPAPRTVMAILARQTRETLLSGKEDVTH